MTGRPPYERDVNTVFQDYALFPHMSVRQNVEYGLRVKKVARPSDATGPRRRSSRCARRTSAGGETEPAVRRAAAAGRPGPGAGQPAQGAAARRAARRPRPQAARADAGRAQGDPARGRHHLRVRHPRPGGGADDERPDRGVQRRPDRAGRHPPARSTSTRPPPSWPALSAPRTCSGRSRRALPGSRGRSFGIRPRSCGRAIGGPARGGRVRRTGRRSPRSCTPARRSLCRRPRRPGAYAFD